MTIEKARKILGKKADHWTDERLALHIRRLSIIADIAAECAIKRFSLQNTTDSVHTNKQNTL